MQFDSVVMKVGRAPAVCDLTIHRTLGGLADGQHEVLGVWAEPSTGALSGQQVFEELITRSFERTRFVVAEPSELRAAFSSATVLVSISHLLEQGLAHAEPRDRPSATSAVAALRTASTARAAHAELTKISASAWGARCPASIDGWRGALAQRAQFFALAPSVRGVVVSTDGAIQRMRTGVLRAIGKHGCCSDRDAAVSLLRGALDRFERRATARAFEARVQPGAGAAGPGIVPTRPSVGR